MKFGLVVLFLGVRAEVVELIRAFILVDELPALAIVNAQDLVEAITPRLTEVGGV